MNIAQLSEQLKDVPQGTLVGYAKNPNSVVPQFLALAEIQRRQQLQAPASAPTGTVADDVLAQAAPQPMAPQQMAPQQMPPQQVDPRMLQAMQAQQLPENQPGVAQLPSGMPQGMAAGGIVAFAGGGMPDMGGDDEDYQDYLENAEQGRIDSGIDEAIASLKGRVAGAARAIPGSIKDAVSGIPASIKDTVSGIRAALPESYTAAKSKVAPSYESAKSAHPYAPVALDEAKKLGLNPNEIIHMLHKETGNLKDPATARSKAGAYGPMQLMPGTAKELGVDINDPEANTRGGVRYYAKMLDMFGGDPTLAMAAYNAGPGRVREMLKRGKGIEALPMETQGYVKRAEGGITKLAKGGLSLEDYDRTMSYDDERGVEPSFAFAPQKFSKEDYYAGQDMGDFEGYSARPLGPATIAPVNPFDAFISKQNAYQDELQSERKQDAYLALMQAGFGMMGGTSPYAMANIGQGASSGINAYANLAKQRAADLSASRKLESSAMSNKILSEIRQAAIDERALAAKNIVEEQAYKRKSEAEEKTAKREDLSRSTATREANDARETALARFNQDPVVLGLREKIKKDVEPGTPQYEWHIRELQRLQNNALAMAKVPGYTVIDKATPYPTESVKAPSAFYQSLPFTTKYSDEDKKALEWANANPLDPRSNQIKERFK